jgi:hypothetical protein
MHACMYTTWTCCSYVETTPPESGGLGSQGETGHLFLTSPWRLAIKLAPG